MPPKAEELRALQDDPAHVRNICILAHVDHGKTSLSDSLISSNGIISQRQAGRMRYLDSRLDEQDRGITMKSSAIALLYDARREGAGGAAQRELINLVDSPGHVDFGSEVSSAVRLADGAVLVVDAVEGVCVQTHTVLQEIWRERLSPVLFVNKIDRLITELRLSPDEAHAHLCRIVDQLNALLGGFASLEHYRTMDGAEGGAGEGAGAGSFEGFAPEQGNVLFGSALHGWAFAPRTFAELAAPRLGVPADEVAAHMWGGWHWSAKAKGFTRDSAGGRLKPAFAQLALATLWRAHAAAADAPPDGGCSDELGRVLSALHISPPAAELRSADAAVRVRGVLSSWLPLADAVLAAVLAHVPPAAAAQRARIRAFWPLPRGARGAARPGGAGAALSAVERRAREMVAACDPLAEHVVVHISKMFVNARGEDAVGFARVYAGTLRARQPLTIATAGGASAAHAGGGAAGAAAAGAPGADAPGAAEGSGAAGGAPPSASAHDVPEGLVQPYLMMGRDLVPVDSVPAGSLCALGGLGAHVRRAATLSSARGLRPFRELWSEGAAVGAPIVRVAIEPARPADSSALALALRRLHQADPSAALEVEPTGESVLGCCGEVHLERCLRDLAEDFAAGIELRVSAPLIPFRETVLPGSSGVATRATADRRCSVRVAVRPLHPHAARWLSARAGLVGGGFGGGGERAEAEAGAGGEAGAAEPDEGGLSAHARAALERLAAAEPPPSADARAAPELGGSAGCAPLAIGSARHATCVLFACAQLASALGARADAGAAAAAADAAADTADTADTAPDASSAAPAGAPPSLGALGPACLAGFQLGVCAGPLCEEPMADVGVSIEALELHGAEEARAEDGAEPRHASSAGGAPLSGQLITAVRDACRAAYAQCAPRLAEAVYVCELQCAQEVLGKMYGTLSRRRARVVSEEALEGTPLFVVRALLPVAESLGFATEMRKTTSGAAHPQLLFSHWQLLEEDPGEGLARIDDDEFERDTSRNRARSYIVSTRRRKGLLVEEKLVEHGTKQRTKARKK